MCLQWDPNSFLVLRVAISCLKIIMLFSAVHSAHCAFTGVKGLACFKMFQVISNFLFSFLSFQMWALRVVPFEFSCFMLWMWPVYLFLKVFAVKPTYFSIFPPSDVTVAWYTSSVFKHSFSVLFVFWGGRGGRGWFKF